MKAIRLLSAGLAVGVLACTSEETPTEPSAGASAARAAGGTYTAVDLGTLGGNVSQARGINPQGQVVGSSTTAEGQTHAFLWAKGVMTDLGLSWPFSVAFAINPRGQVVVGTGDAALLWEKGVISPLSTVGSATPYDINPAGQVVGVSETITDHFHAFHAFRWDKGVMTDLGTLGGFSSQATGINPAGQVVGESATAGYTGSHAFLWEKGVMIDLATLGGCCSFANGINPAGQVVGWSVTTGGEIHGFL